MAKEKTILNYLLSVTEVLEKEAEERGVDVSRIYEAKTKVKKLLEM